MTKFVLIDHSLGGIGGHHYDYAVHVLRAADAAGYETVLAANRRFRNRGGFPTSCRCFPLFRFHTYSKYTLFAGNARRLIDPSRGAAEADGNRSAWQTLAGIARRPWRWIGDLRHRGGPQRRVTDFRTSCQRLFQKVTLGENDQVFVPTLSEIDLMALAEYWRCDPRTELADWHLQFHFNIFDGREPEYDAQHFRLDQLRRHLQATLKSVPQHRLSFYNTTEQLAAQYNRMGVAPFEPLPYPVNDALFRSSSGRVAGGPLRVTCAGGTRSEKGFDGLADVTREIWDDLLAGGKLQLLVQSKPARLSSRPRLQLPVPRDAATASCVARPNDSHVEPVVYVRYPLKIDDYVELVRRADVGLFLYDSDRYYVRRAGIMGEFLSAGVPVIVPAGCWLSEQIAEPIYEHLDQLRQSLPLVARIAGDSIDWRAAGADGDTSQPFDTLIAAGTGNCNFDRRAMQFGTVVAGRGTSLSFGGATAAVSGDVSVPTGATELFVSFRRVEPAGPGTYVRIIAEQFDDAGNSLGENRQILGERAGSAPAVALVKIENGARTIRLRWRNAYHDTQVTLQDVALDFVDSAESPSVCCTSGAVGLIAADVQQVPRLLREMVLHYDHYRRTAEVFSRDWNQAHAPQRTIEALAAHARQPIESFLKRAA